MAVYALPYRGHDGSGSGSRWATAGGKLPTKGGMLEPETYDYPGPVFSSDLGRGVWAYRLTLRRVAVARADRANRRACLSGSGVRPPRASWSTRWHAVSRLIRHAGWIQRGLESALVCTSLAPVPPLRARSVTPTVGRSSTAPRWSARPAWRGWSTPVALTSSTSGRALRVWGSHIHRRAGYSE
jgi:hypothetical protein